MDHRQRPLRRAIFTLLFIFAIGVTWGTSAHATRKTREVIEVSENSTFVAKEASSAIELRELRRVGVLAAAAGPFGNFGMGLELNFTSTDSALVGYGVGDPFQAIVLEWKHYLNGEWLTPYLSAGFTRWANSVTKGQIVKTSPTYLSDRLMNQGDKDSGIISENLVFPAIGIQYYQLKGPWAGMSVAAELILLLDIGNMAAAPTGTVSTTYFF